MVPNYADTIRLVQDAERAGPMATAMVRCASAIVGLNTDIDKAVGPDASDDDLNHAIDAQVDKLVAAFGGDIRLALGHTLGLLGAYMADSAGMM